MASMFASNVRKMVALAANAYFEEEDIDMIRKVKDVKDWSPRMRAPMEAVYGSEYFAQLWEDWVNAMVKMADATPDRDICGDRLSEIRCPSMIVHGSQDAMVSGEHPEMLHKRIKNSK